MRISNENSGDISGENCEENWGEKWGASGGVVEVLVYREAGDDSNTGQKAVTILHFKLNIVLFVD